MRDLILAVLLIGPFVVLGILHLWFVHVTWPRLERRWRAEQERAIADRVPRNPGIPTIYR